jgi:signal transduction histidine kinase
MTARAEATGRIRQDTCLRVLGWWPPLDRREFWIVQALVVAIALGHAVNEWLLIVNLDGAEFIPVTLYLVPVVYAALNFGVRGSLPTALWAVALTVPNILLWHHGASAWGELWQTILVVAVGLFVGHRVDIERVARDVAESRERERRASEERYRALFELAADAVLLLDDEGRLLEANPAAVALLEDHPGRIVGAQLSLLNPGIWRALMEQCDGERPPLEIASGGRGRWVETLAVWFRNADGAPRILGQLRDVTHSVERQRLAEGFTRRMMATREEERGRIARDLHDGPLQSVMLLRRNLDSVDGACCSGACESMDEARQHVEAIADELRRFSRELRPSILDDLGLVPALRAEAFGLAHRTGIQVTNEVRGSHARLPTDVELTLFRICQEALHNIERHAGAQRAHVEAEFRPSGYRLQVADDGVGFDTLVDPTELLAGGQLGIAGMYERARLIGASCSIKSSSSWSTVVEINGVLQAHLT